MTRYFKYSMLRALLFLFVFMLVMFNVNATEITNNQFASKINKCVNQVYDKKDQSQKIHRIPVELIIAQAAHESAWGKSRFAKEGNNLFGIRTWDLDNIPHMKAKGNPDANWGVRKYKSWCHSIEDYISILQRHPAYEAFREELEFQYDFLGEAEAITLTQHLGAWSEQGEKYIRLLQDILQSLYDQNFFKKIT